MPSSDSESAKTSSAPRAAAGHAAGSTMRTATFQGGAERRPASSIDGSMPCTASATSAVTIGVKAMVSTPIAPADVNSASG